MQLCTCFQISTRWHHLTSHRAASIRYIPSHLISATPFTYYIDNNDGAFDTTHRQQRGPSFPCLPIPILIPRRLAVERVDYYHGRYKDSASRTSPLQIFEQSRPTISTDNIDQPYPLTISTNHIDQQYRPIISTNNIDQQYRPC